MPFKHLLVPLDGSSLAEAALPAAVCLAQKLPATVTLVHVIEQGAPQRVHGERHLTDPKEAAQYLNQVVAQFFPPGIEVSCHVHTSAVEDVARSIYEHTGELSPDMVVMTTHGSGGFHRRLFGSIAQQILALGMTPVLLVYPGQEGGVPFACRTFMVPLDGTPAHEQALPVAMEVARSCAAALHLLVVVPTVGTLGGERAAAGVLLPGATAAVLEIDQDNAALYLEQKLAEVQGQQVLATASISRGDPARTIVREAQRVGADVILMSTHGRSGTEAFWSGSVAPWVSGHSHLPLLLVPVHDGED